MIFNCFLSLDGSRVSPIWIGDGKYKLILDNFFLSTTTPRTSLMSLFWNVHLSNQFSIPTSYPAWHPAVLFPSQTPADPLDNRLPATEVESVRINDRCSNSFHRNTGPQLACVLTPLLVLYRSEQDSVYTNSPTRSNPMSSNFQMTWTFSPPPSCSDSRSWPSTVLTEFIQRTTPASITGHRNTKALESVSMCNFSTTTRLSKINNQQFKSL